MTFIIISLSFTLSLTAVSMLFDVYLKLLEVTEDSDRIIVGLMETNMVRFVKNPEKSIHFIQSSSDGIYQSTPQLKKAA